MPPGGQIIETKLGSPNAASIFFFFVIVVVTLIITYWAAKRTKTSKEFYAAGRSVSAAQNGLALAGDYMSAASFLGISGMVALKGYDGMIYATGWLVGWPALMFLIAEPLRNLGKFTFSDVVAFRLQQGPVRVACAIGGILTVLTYTIAQMVGSGALIKLMFGIPYEVAEMIVGCVMLAYVLFGGMIATTWVQIIKACLLIFGVTVLTILVLAKFGFRASVLLSTPGKLGRDFIREIDKGGNMASPLVAELLAGTPFLGFIAAVAFATILAVVAGLTLAGASAYSHDIYVSIIKKGKATEEQQVTVAKRATLVFGVCAVLLGILFKGQNVAFMVGLTFSIAASANFPALLLSIVWKRFSTWGAVTSIISGTFISIFMIVISKTVWVDVLHNAEPLIGLKNPCIVSMTAAFAIGMVVSLLTPDARAQALFEDEKLRVYLGVGAE